MTKSVAVTKPSRKMDVVAALTKVSMHLPLSTYAIDSIAKFAVGVDDATYIALLQLLAQPDPHGHLCVTLNKIIRSNWFEDDDATAAWIRNANLCFHAVNAIYQGILGSEVNAPDSVLFVPLRIVDGVQRLRAYDTSYTPVQLTDFARIAAASYSVMLTTKNPLVTQNQNGEPSIPMITGEKYQHNVYSIFLNSKLFLNRASDHGTADEIVRIITENRVYLRETILYCLDGGHPALVGGVI